MSHYIPIFSKISYYIRITESAIAIASCKTYWSGYVLIGKLKHSDSGPSYFHQGILHNSEQLLDVISDEITAPCNVIISVTDNSVWITAQLLALLCPTRIRPLCITSRVYEPGHVALTTLLDSENFLRGKESTSIAIAHRTIIRTTVLFMIALTLCIVSIATLIMKKNAYLAVQKQNALTSKTNQEQVERENKFLERYGGRKEILTTIQFRNRCAWALSSVLKRLPAEVLVTAIRQDTKTLFIELYAEQPLSDRDMSLFFTQHAHVCKKEEPQEFSPFIHHYLIKIAR